MQPVKLLNSYRELLLNKILGRRLASHEQKAEKIGVFGGVPTLGLDGLASAAYGPEAALAVLIPIGLLGSAYILPISCCIGVLLLILYFSYLQTTATYPTGGGSYIVARENLGINLALLAAASLILDYILNVAVGISAGVAALVSAIPQLHPYTLILCLFMLATITTINLRGVRASAFAFAIPTYLFIVSLLGVLLIGVYKSIASAGHPTPVVPPTELLTMTGAPTFWLLLRSFASGCTAMTGVEAVSNGITVFGEPRIKKAQATLTAIVGTLFILLMGIAYLARSYSIGAMEQNQAGYQSVLSQLTGAVVGRGPFYYITIISVLMVLCLSANTSFADFPRLCRALAEDDFLPHAFANLGRRLVYTIGISILAVIAALLLIGFGGITDRLIPLFAVGAFLAFTLSQAGMVMHWRRQRGRAAKTSLVINTIGMVSTLIALCAIIAAKFMQGAWVTLLLIPAMICLFRRVKNHYDHVQSEIACDRPIDADEIQPPMVVVPVESWSSITEKAMRFALSISSEILAVYVSTQEGDEEELQEHWRQYIAPLAQKHLPIPRLVTLHSPYRLVHDPILQFIDSVSAHEKNRTIVVVIPELVQFHWDTHLLHNHRAANLKNAILSNGNRSVAIVDVPWYLGDTNPCETNGSNGTHEQSCGRDRFGHGAV